MLLPAAALLGAGCAGNAPKPDYTAFRDARPRSVLVLPPVNKATDVRATYGWLTTATRPLAEMGYYVFPVAMVDQFLKENGLPTAGEMHQAPLNKLREVFGTDSVLYVDIEGYGTKYQLLASVTFVAVTARLVDARTAAILWTGRAMAQQSGSGNSGGGLLGALVEAAISQAINSGQDTAHQLSVQANQCLFAGRGPGVNGAGCFSNGALLYGPYHPQSEAQYAALLAAPVSTGTVAAAKFDPSATAAPVEEQEVARSDWKSLAPQSPLKVYAKDGEVFSGSFASFDGEYLWLKLETGRRKSVLASQVSKLALVKR